MTKRILSCQDIEGSLYLAPSAVRTCCKRFYVDGKRKGDVELFTNVEEVSMSKIVHAKAKLLNVINNSRENVCAGCPYLEYGNWSAKPKRLKHLSIEHHSICNLKCVYCSETYYGGDYAPYDIISLLETITQEYNLELLESIVWGGGEPFLDKNKDKIFLFLRSVLEKNNRIDIRIFSNAIKYDEDCQKLLDENRINLTTSIDAGTASKYKSVRGKDKLDLVLANLKRYSALRPNRVTIKYIFTNENSDKLEIESFIRKIIENNLQNCNFQISIDFNLDNFSEAQFRAIVTLSDSLFKLNVNHVFLDDLIYLRLQNFYINQFKNKEPAWMKEIDPMNLIRHDLGEPIAVWGAGQIGKSIVEKTKFAKVNKLVAFVDRNFREFESLNVKTNLSVLNPEVLVHKDYKIIIGAAQSYQSILREAESLGIPRDRFIRGIIV